MDDQIRTKLKNRINEVLGLMITKADELKRLEAEKKGLQFALDAMDEAQNVAN